MGAMYICVGCRREFEQDTTLKRAPMNYGQKRGPKVDVLVASGPAMLCRACTPKYAKETPLSIVEGLKRTKAGKEELARRNGVVDEETFLKWLDSQSSSS